MSITKIVITGGPCAGKSSVLPAVYDELTRRGFVVLTVPEGAYELLIGNVGPKSLGSVLLFEKYVFLLQLENEKIFKLAANEIKDKPVVLLYERGVMDGKAYLSDNEFAELLQSIGKTESEICADYDAVFHLVTAAKDAKDSYTTANNHVRLETAAEAIRVDDRLIEAWSAHPNHFIIDNSTEFEEKKERLIQGILSVLEHH
ncbi:MAG: ATP-binding protein [Anaerolineaceae bacterium]|nr:ATP-binding protein [Anaerolineaceae bacterium]MBQ6492419.1 ATP-binding protein [Erysipelotrichaceae bacterium]